MSKIQVTVEQHDSVGAHKPAAFVPNSVNEIDLKLVEDRDTQNPAYKFYKHMKGEELIGTYIVGSDTLTWCAKQAGDDAIEAVKDSEGKIIGYIVDTDKFTVKVNKSEYAV